MKETIYTIPLNEAFDEPGECPMCILYNKLEADAVEYYLGPSMMEPDSRIDTNDRGFCREHYTLMYHAEINRLPYSLMMETHYMEQIQRMEKTVQHFQKTKKPLSLKEVISGKSKKDKEPLKELIDQIDSILEPCCICAKIDETMERFLDVFFYLYFKEEEFKNKALSNKGYCLQHLKDMLVYAQDHLKYNQQLEFASDVFALEIPQLKRINEDISWFVKKFDYRYTQEPWKNSKDALPRSIEKFCRTCKLD